MGLGAVSSTRDIERGRYDEHAVAVSGRGARGRRRQGGAGVAAARAGADGRRSAPPPSLARLNQRHGFDCPGCAWPEEHGGRKLAEFCENGAKAVAEEATKRVVTPEFFARHSVAELAAKPEYWLSQQGRLTHPMVLRPGDDHYRPIDWDDALPADRRRAARAGQPRTRRCSTRRGAPATRPRSSTSCWSAASAPTTCPTARTCATSRRAPRWPRRSASARARSRSRTSPRPT